MWPTPKTSSPPAGQNAPPLRIILEPAQKTAPAAAPAQGQKPATPAPQSAAKPDRSAAYYHFMVAHIYEELATSYQQTEFATKAIEEYKLAIENDPEGALALARANWQVQREPADRRILDEAERAAGAK